MQDIGATLELAATVLYCYDCVLTFGDEVEHFWDRKFTQATLLYMINRYVMLVNRLIRLTDFVHWGHHSQAEADRICNSIWRLSEVCTMIMHISMAVFSALRLWAILDRSWAAFGAVLSFECIGPLVNIYYNATLSIKALPPPAFGCGQSSRLDDASKVVIIGLGSVLTFFVEATVLVLTWVRTVRTRVILHQFGLRKSTVGAIWRDGLVYSTVLIAMAGLSLLAVRQETFADIPALTDVLFSIALSRSMLNLRTVAAQEAGGIHSQSKVPSTRHSSILFIASGRTAGSTAEV